MFTITQTCLRQARIRRFSFVSIILLILATGTGMMANILAKGGFTVLDVAILILFAILFAQVAFGFTLAITGYWVLRHGGDPLRITNTLPADAGSASRPSTAVVMPVFNEDVARVFQAVRVMYESLQNTGEGAAFDFFVLSDSNDPNHWVEEEKTWLDLCKQVQGFGRIFYRKRRVTLHHKSGNIADFCRRWGANYRYMIVLDADSIMTAEVFLKLVQLMERNRSVGIIQTAPQIVLGESLYGRMQQFAARVYGPLFSAGANFWHLDTATYWGHNAIIRLKPFMQHCALPELPKKGAALGAHILSHDAVEAALMRAAGYSVWFAYDLEGSYEEGPPDLLATPKRDRRWCQGNVQHIQLLNKRHLRAASRIHLLIGIMAYVSAPIWLLFIVLTTIEALRHSGEHAALTVTSPQTSAPQPAFLFGYVIVLLLFPKFLGLLRAWKLSDRIAAFRKRTTVLLSVMAETLFSALTAPIFMWFYTKFVFSALSGLPVKWGRQNRGEERPGWRTLIETHGVQMVFAVAVLEALAWWSPALLPWLAPVLVGLIFAIPLSRLISSIDLGRQTRAAGFFLIPEETNPPPELQRIHGRIPTRVNPFFQQPHYATHYGLLQAVLDPYIHALHVSLLRLREEPREQSRQYTDDLSERLLTQGPASLTPEERATLLWDAESMVALHKELWICPAFKLDEWWQQALRHYNETIAIATRRSV